MKVTDLTLNWKNEPVTSGPYLFPVGRHMAPLTSENEVVWLESRIVTSSVTHAKVEKQIINVFIITFFLSPYIQKGIYNYYCWKVIALFHPPLTKVRVYIQFCDWLKEKIIIFNKSTCKRCTRTMLDVSPLFFVSFIFSCFPLVDVLLLFLYKCEQMNKMK